MLQSAAVPAFHRLKRISEADMDWQRFDWLIAAALREDCVDEDVTALSIAGHADEASAVITAGGEGVICGMPLADRIARKFAHKLSFEALAEEGARVRPGQKLARLAGSSLDILRLERVTLNFLGRLSGVASLTARFVERVRGTGARIYDTRKTTPGWRELEKYAVRCGGGHNHRMGLADQGLIKENHLRVIQQAAPTPDERALFEKAVSSLRESAAPGMIVEVEVEDLTQLRAALAARPDVVMFDNFTPEQTREAVGIVEAYGEGSRPATEASGGVTLDNVREYAEAGVDRIAVGAITHSAAMLDLSLEIV